MLEAILAISGKLRGFRQRLTQLEAQPLSRATLVVLIFLDVFILLALFEGLEAQSRQLTSAAEAIPGLCRELVIEQSWNAANRLERLTRSVRQPQRWPDSDRPGSALHPLCQPLLAALEAVREESSLKAQFNDWYRLDQEGSSTRQRIGQLKGAYDTALLEKIADERPAGDPLVTMRTELTGLSARLEEIAAHKAGLGAALQEAPVVRQFFALLDGLGDAERTVLSTAVQQMNFWYPLKRLGMELLFLLPLLLVFYAWNARSVNRQRPYQTLLSAHLLVVSMVPGLFELIRLAYDILPRRLLRNFIELLESIGLIAIWHYLVIVASIGIALTLIYLFQKKLISPERLMLRRIAKGECQGCGLHLPPTSRHCPGCGLDQYRQCQDCGAPTLAHGRFCTVCGSANSAADPGSVSS